MGIEYKTKSRSTKAKVSGGPRISLGGVDSRGGYVSKILYVKTKESGPLGATWLVGRKTLMTLLKRWYKKMS